MIKYLKGIGIMLSFIFAAVVFAFRAGGKNERANQNQQILNNVKTARKIEEDNSNLSTDELIDKL